MGSKPVALVLTREIDKGLASLVKAIDTLCKENTKTGAFVVVLGKDDKGAEEKLKKLASEHGIKIPLTINKDSGAEKKLKVNPKAKHTVLIYKKKKVVASFGASELSDATVKEIAAAAKKCFQG